MWVWAFSQALLHSIWQIALIAGLLWGTLKLIPSNRAHLRYTLSFAVLLMVPITFTATVVLKLQHVGGVSTALGNATLPANSKFLVTGWAIGALFMLARLALNWRDVHRLTRQPIDPLPSHIVDIFNRLKIKMIGNSGIKFGVSHKVPSPCTVGFWRPIVLLPMACLSNLSVDEIEAILAHELAHIRRHDYLQRCVQSLVEAVFYYHPALHYISGAVSREREYACDDLAGSVLADPKPLATGLLKASLSGHSNKMVLQARSPGVADLKTRIGRLLDRTEFAAPPHTRKIRPWLASCLLAMIMISTLWLSILPRTANADAGGVTKSLLLSLKDEVCTQFHADNIYWNPTYDEGGTAHVLVRADGVYMNGAALPPATQLAVRSMFKKRGLDDFSVAKLTYYGESVELTLKQIEDNRQAHVRRFTLAPGRDNMQTRRFTVPLKKTS